MINVIRLIGDSFDFSTNSYMEKALVLSNGKKECVVPITAEKAQEIISILVLEEGEETPSKEAKAPAKKPKRKRRTKKEMEEARNKGARKEPVPASFQDFAGYEDPATGVASI